MRYIDLTMSTKLNDTLESLENFMRDVRDKNDVPQETYVMEECAELTKELSKNLRHKGDELEIQCEACDVIASILVLLKQMHVSENDVLDMIKAKYDRAVSRAEKNGEF